MRCHSFFVVLISLLSSVCYGQGKQLKQVLLTTCLGTYADGELELQEEHAAPNVLTWDKNGLFLSQERLDSIDGDPFEAFIYTYNADKTLKTSTSNFGKEDNVYRHFYEYDNQGKLTLRVECDESGFGLIERFSNKYYWFRKSKDNK